MWKQQRRRRHRLWWLERGLDAEQRFLGRRQYGVERVLQPFVSELVGLCLDKLRTRVRG